MAIGFGAALGFAAVVAFPALSSPAPSEAREQPGPPRVAPTPSPPPASPPPAAPASDELQTPGQPATRAARRVLAVVSKVEANLQQTRYQHRTVIRRSQGLYAWDCSGMVSWILRRAAPNARRAIKRKRPVAASYFRAIDRAPTRRFRRGWKKLAHIRDAQPGDLFAWLRPPNFASKNTGHVGFVVERPRPVPGIEGAWVVRILDATSLPHQDDTRDREGEGGFGYGTILFLADPDGEGTAYGWFGTRSRGVIPTRIVFGRVRA